MRNPLFFTLLFCVLSTSFGFSQESPSQTERWDLQKCITHAVENNISVSQSYLKQKNSELQYRQARMNRLPSISASASQSLLTPTTTSVGVNANVNIFNGFNTENNIKKSKLELEKQASQTEQTIFDIEIAVAEAYLQILYYKDNIVISEKQLKSSEEELKLAEAKYKVGAIAKKDLSDIEAQHANNQYALIRAQNMYVQQELTLKQLLELTPDEQFAIDDNPIEATDYDVPSPLEVYNNACQLLPEIKTAEQQLAIDSLSVKLAKSSYYPSLSLSAGVGANGNFFENESEWAGNQSLRLSLSVPIFNRYQTKTNVETTKINAEYNALAVESTKKQLYKEIEVACNNANGYQKELEALKKSLAAAEESYTLAQKQFNVGATSATALLLAETKFIDANLSYIQAQYMAILSRIVLDHYQGKPISL